MYYSFTIGNERDNCAAISSGKIPGLWSDSQSNVARPYLCERTRDGYTTTMPPTTTIPKPCPQDWQEYEGFCYRVGLQYYNAVLC